MDYTLILDEGTTSTRAIVFDDDGNVLSSSNRQLKTFYPSSGWIEQSADEVFTKSLEVIDDAIEQCGCTPKFFGITNQRETIVGWDKETGKSLYNAIIWRDKRGQPLCEKFKAFGYESVIRAKTGLLLDPYFSASKISWLIDNVPEISEKMVKGKVKFGTIDSYLVWKLTGQHFTEPSNASRTLLFNINEMYWDDELLDLFKIPVETLPEVKHSNTDFGSSKYGELFSVLGDQQASLFGNLCLEEGQVKCTYGTGAFILANAGQIKAPPTNGLLKTIAWSINGKVTYALEGSVLSSGESINWLKRLSLIRDEVEIEEIAKDVKSDGIYFIPALDGLGSPRWVPAARALLIGLNSSHNRTHIVRAVLESMAFSVTEVIETFKNSGIDISSVNVDGGGSKNSLMIQILSDSVKIKIERSRFHEMTAYGAFLMTKLDRLGEIDKILKLKKDFDLFEPKNDIGDLYDQWKMAEDFSIRWSEQRR
jgi:glycerol kinase